jgi:hypothetical protein
MMKNTGYWFMVTKADAVKEVQFFGYNGHYLILL